MAWLPNGDFYAAGLAGIDRFAPAGKLQASLLALATGPASFPIYTGLSSTPSAERIIVPIVATARMQLFDLDWNFVGGVAAHLAPSWIMESKTEPRYGSATASPRSCSLRSGGSAGHFVGAVGHRARLLLGIHWFDVDEEALCTSAEVYGERVQKLVRRADVSPTTTATVGQLHRY